MCLVVGHAFTCGTRVSTITNLTAHARRAIRVRPIWPRAPPPPHWQQTTTRLAGSNPPASRANVERRVTSRSRCAPPPPPPPPPPLFPPPFSFRRLFFVRRQDRAAGPAHNPLAYAENTTAPAAASMAGRIDPAGMVVGGRERALQQGPRPARSDWPATPSLGTRGQRLVRAGSPARSAHADMAWAGRSDGRPRQAAQSLVEDQPAPPNGIDEEARSGRPDHRWRPMSDIGRPRYHAAGVPPPPPPPPVSPFFLFFFFLFFFLCCFLCSRFFSSFCFVLSPPLLLFPPVFFFSLPGGVFPLFFRVSVLGVWGFGVPALSGGGGFGRVFCFCPPVFPLGLGIGQRSHLNVCTLLLMVTNEKSGREGRCRR